MGGATGRRSVHRRSVERAVAAVSAEGRGVYKLLIVDAVCAPQMIAAALAGDLEARRYVTAVSHCIARIAAGRDRPLCLTCEQEFSARSLPLAFAFVFAGRDDPTVAIANGLCGACASAPNRQERVLAYYRKNLFGGDLRILPPLASGSKARN